ncbi:MAG: FAD:protein FMN transferase [Bacilli bacterium]|nr:FAD:protein FMN transferase [Bacilli bacterium]
MKKISRLFSSLLSIALLTSCTNETPIGDNYRFTTDGISIHPAGADYINVQPFNTSMSFFYVNKYDDLKNSEELQEIKSTYQNIVVDLHKKLDRHYSYNDDDGNRVVNVKDVNDSYGTNNKVYCSKELYNLLKLGRDMTLKTNGYFNFFIGGLVDFWDDLISDYEYAKLQDPLVNPSNKDYVERLTACVPTMDEVKDLFTFNDDEYSVIFNTIPDIVYKGATINRTNADSPYRPYITSGGLSKGYGTDIIKDLLIQKGYDIGYLNSGASSITSLSPASITFPKKYLQIATVNPLKINYYDDFLYVWKFDEEYSLSTSGNYTIDKYYNITDTDGVNHRRHHIINPFTGYPSEVHSTVSIYSPYISNGQLDALSTAFENMPLDDIKAFVKEEYQDFLGYVVVDVNNEELSLHISNNVKSNIINIAKGVKIIYE